jgi:hypothetical protein
MPVIDRIDSFQRGAVALWLAADGVAVESGRRPSSLGWPALAAGSL